MDTAMPVSDVKPDLTADNIRHTNTVWLSLKSAMDYQQKGDWGLAEERYNSILEMDPRNPDAIHLLGVLHHQIGRVNNAIALITRAISIFPSNPFYYNNLGSSYRKNSELKKAGQCYKMALRLKPDYPEALYNMAGIYHLTEKYDQALTFYQKALTMNPRFTEALNNMAATLNILGKYEQAVECCRMAIEIKPKYSESLNNMGNAYKALGKLDYAIACYEKSIALAGESAEVLCNIANALQEKGKNDEAISIYGKAIKLNPSYGKARNNLGTAFRSKRMLKEAEHEFRYAIKLVSKDAEAHHNLGNVYYDKGDFDSASLWYDKASSINPRSVQTFINRGILYQESGQSDCAMDCFKKALELDPQNSKAHSHMVHELYQRCEWGPIDALNAKIDKFTERELANGQRPNEMPFLSIIRNADPSINHRVSERWSREITKITVGNKGHLKFRHIRPKQKKIIIGYLSNNFRNHPTSHLINDIFALHDRSRFTINAYSYGEDDGSCYREKIRQKSDSFFDLRKSIHEHAAQQIYNDRVDILVDLVGYMRGNRMEICAYRPAPVQVRWLGLAGTTGAHFYDYIVTDNIVTPENQASFYSEKFIYMPICYQVNSKPLRKSNKKVPKKNDLGLPESGFIYCCFCSSYKIEAVIFRNWMNILKKVPDSVLWLLGTKSIVKNNLRKEAYNCGITPERLIFAKKINKADHLERIKYADLGLDTRIVNGAATTSDSLFSGVPVITLKGRHFASRMAASINNAVGINDLVVENLSDYMELAIALGRNPKRYETIKMRLGTNLNSDSLFDTSRFVRNLEKAYFEMLGRHRNQKSPKMIRINES